MRALEARHLSNLRVPEVTRALRALSSAYVERRQTAVHRALDSAGKRAAFALFYAPLHFLTTHLVVHALGAHTPPRAVVDLGCGTGAAGAAWAIASNGTSVLGIDQHPWAAAEARWTYRKLGIDGRARVSDVARMPKVRPDNAILAAYVLNELRQQAREHLIERFVEAAGRGTRVLIIEPVARRLIPWWPSMEARMRSLPGWRADEWRFPIVLPQPLQLLDTAAGFNHSELTARSLYCPGSIS